MIVKRMMTAVAVVGVLATATVTLAETAPTGSGSSDVQRATHRYLVGVTGMT
jgi:hypothetical protein